jgi:hypothetical protein
MNDNLNGSHRNGPQNAEDGDILPEIRPELVEAATQAPQFDSTNYMAENKSRFPPAPGKIPKDARPEERMAMIATGAPIERVRELQSLPNPGLIQESIEKLGTAFLTGDPEIDQLYAECIKCFAEKGAEYTVGSKDRLANFRGVAQDVDVPMEKVWYTFFNKHLRALQSYIKNGCTVKSNEPIRSRIMDLIVYLTLFHKMSLEIERKREEALRAEHGVIS